MLISEPIQKKCAFCESADLSQILDFGEVALAGGFLKPENFDSERYYPLSLFFCNHCFAVQVLDRIDPEVLFRDYFYFSSSINTLRQHFRQFAIDVSRRFLNPLASSVLEFGCNDGVLLKPFLDLGFKTVVGVDPARNVTEKISDKRVTVFNDFFNESTAGEIVAKYGKFDLVAANNVYAHIPDIQGVTRAVEMCLARDGIFIFEVHYLGKVISEMQYDMIYHEHLYYYSLLALQNHFKLYDFIVFDCEAIPTHAGSMRFYVCRLGSRYAAPTDRLKALEIEELNAGYDRFNRFHLFSKHVNTKREELLTLLRDLKRRGKTIAGYGASGRANTMIQYCGLSQDILDFMIDDAPAKQGFYTPGSHFEIKGRDVLIGDSPPDYVLVFAWSFFEEIRGNNHDYLAKGGKMILPLPTVTIVDRDGL